MDELIKDMSEENYQEYIKTIQFGYLDTLKNIKHIPNMIKECEADIANMELINKRSKDEESKLQGMKVILVQNKADMKENKRNIAYYRDILLYIKSLRCK